MGLVEKGHQEQEGPALAGYSTGTPSPTLQSGRCFPHPWMRPQSSECEGLAEGTQPVMGPGTSVAPRPVHSPVPGRNRQLCSTRKEAKAQRGQVTQHHTTDKQRTGV